ncbi:MAG: hypothetical protein GTO46_11725 [Gemmatimonadetes bacterium]|nr:hypothetical protein [Gemmatimonadota bacterium]NIO32258.1 hypothetical protein [Gemmatimonadota bacterium]
MLRYDASITIDRPVEEVFEYMQDIDREHEWQPNLREAEQSPKGEPSVGTRRRYVSEFMGKRFENVYVNTVYEPNRRVTYKSASESDAQAEGEITWEALDNGTRVTMRVALQVGGLLRFVPKSLIVSLGTKELQDALARAKARLESTD